MAKIMQYIQHNAGLFLRWLRNEREASYGEDTSFEDFLHGRQPAKIEQAAQRMRSPKEYFHSPAYLGQQDRADWQHTHSDIRRFAAQLVEALRKREIAFYVHGAFRTRDEQQRLYNDGKTTTLWPKAAHCQGAAVDVVHSRFHWNLTKGEWAYIGKLGKEIAARQDIDVVWGGDWKNPWDPAHWELADWRQNIQYHQPLKPERLNLTLNPLNIQGPQYKTARKLLRDNPKP